MTTIRSIVLAVVLALSLALGAGAPASAASKPPKVGLVTFTAAGLSGGKASLTFTWSKVSRAKAYEVFISSSYSGVMKAKVAKRTSGSTVTMSGLTPGRNYFVTVRGVNGSAKGTRSSRVGHATISAQGPGRGATYSVMTYNICSEKSGCHSPWSWAKRRPKVLANIAREEPDVLAMQESKVLAQTGHAAVPGYTRAAYFSSKSLYFRTDRLQVVPRTDEVTYPSEPGMIRSRCGSDPNQRYGCLTLSGARKKYAVWAELEHRATGQRAIFVSAHLTSGKSGSTASARRSETAALLKGVARINPDDLPVVVAGDFNSHKNRSNDHPATEFRAKGYRDAYDLAMKLSRQHNNSYNDYKTTPVRSVTWGDHVDHVWAQHRRVRVKRWANVNPIKNSRHTTPIGSDHSPIVVDVQLD